MMGIIIIRPILDQFTNNKIVDDKMDNWKNKNFDNKKAFIKEARRKLKGIASPMFVLLSKQFNNEHSKISMYFVLMVCQFFINGTIRGRNECYRKNQTVLCFRIV